MKLPATIKGSSKSSPRMVERQREINQEVNARYKQLVGGHVGGRAAQDAGESDLKAHEIVERYRHRVVALSEEYNKLKLRAERKEERAKELHLMVTLEASAGGLRAPMTDHELELILEERKELQQHHSPSKGGGGGGGADMGRNGGAASSMSDVAIFAGHAAVHRALVAESSSAKLDSTDAENFSLREDLRAKLSERDEFFEEERRMTGTYNLIASRLVKTKKEEAARNADLGDVMASRDAQLERLKADLMMQDKMTKKVMDELRTRQEMLMGRRRAWEERRQDLLDIVEEAVSKSNSDELRDAVNLRNQAFANRVAKLGIKLEDLKPEEKPKVSVSVARTKSSSTPRAAAAAAASASAAAKNAKEGGGGGGGAGGKVGRGGKERKSGKDAGAMPDTKKQQRRRSALGTGGGAGENHDHQQEHQQLATHGSAEEEAELAAVDADDAVGGGKAGVEGGGGGGGAEDEEGERHRSASPALIAAGNVGLSQYKREAKKQQTQRRLAIQLELEQERELEETEKEEAEKERGDLRDLLKRDAENRVLAERERIRKERLAEIEAKSLSRKADPAVQKKLHELGGGGEITDQRSKMEKLFSLITRSLGMPESTDAMIVADTIADLALEQRSKELEEAECARRREAEEAGKTATAVEGEEGTKASAGGGDGVALAVAVVAGLASAQLNANRSEKEALLREKRKQLAAYRAEVQAKLTAKANEISGGGLASVKDVVNLEEKIESTASHTEWTMTRVATSSKIAKNASMGINELYALLRRKGRVWRASDIFGKPNARWDDADPFRSSSRLSGGPSSPNAAGAAALERRLSLSDIDDDWDLDNDPSATVHPGPPLAEGEGDTSADDGGMLEMNRARIDDVAASLVAMTRAVRVDGVVVKGRRKSKLKLTASGEDGGADAATSSIRGGDDAGKDADVSPSLSRRTSMRRVKLDGVDGDDYGGGGGGRSDGDGGDGGDGGGDNAGKEHAEAATGVVPAKMSSFNMKQSTKKMLSLRSVQENFNFGAAAAAKAEFRGLKMNFEVDSSSSDDDDVQAGGRARKITSADSDDSDDDMNYSGTEGLHGGRHGVTGGGGRGGLSGGGRGKIGERGTQGMMARAKKSSSSSEREDENKLPRHDRGKAKSSGSTELPATLGSGITSSASSQETSSTGAAAAASSSSSMPKISESLPASGRTPIRTSDLGGGGKKKSVTAADEKVTSVTGGKDLYSGKVKKMAGNPEYPTGFFDSQPHSGSRSFSADRPLPV